MFADTHRSIARVVSIGVLGIASLAPCSARAQSAAEHDDAELVLAEPDFRVLNLPSTLRLPLHGSNFELTHRFNGNLRRGSFSEQASNLFGLDEGAGAQEATLLDYLHEVEHMADRIGRLEGAIDDAVKTAPERMRAVIDALQALRGIAVVSAVTIAAEVGELSRFAKPRQLMGYCGAVSSEDSTGRRIRRSASQASGVGQPGGESHCLEGPASAVRSLPPLDRAGKV